MSTKPKRIALNVESEFRASHTLAGFEVPHYHLWKVNAEFQQNLPLTSDRVIDLVHLQALMTQILSPLNHTFLNSSLNASPTSENVAIWVWNQLAEHPEGASLSQVQIKLCDLEGKASLTARIFL